MMGEFNLTAVHEIKDSKMDILKIGDQAPYFCLTGTDGLIHSLSDFLGSSCLVVIFTSNHCPYAKMYEGLLSALSSRYKALGVHFLAVCSNDGTSFPEDSFENMKLKDFPYPYLHDDAQLMAEAFGAQATPEVFAFDKHLRLRYHGPVVENPEKLENAPSDDKPLNLFEGASSLERAIESIINDVPMANPEIPLIGCSIKWSN